MSWVGSAGATNTGSTSSLAVTVSGIGIQSGDIVIIIVNGWNTGATISSSGFSSISGLSTVNLSSTGSILCALYKVAGSSEPSSYTVSSTTSDVAAIQCNVFRGRNTTSTFTAVSTVTESTSVSPVTVAAPTVTAAAGDDVFYTAVVGGNYNDGGGNSATLTAPTNFTNVTNTSGSTAFVGYIGGASHTNVSAGATGSVSGSVTETTSVSSDYSGYLISIAQAPAAPPAPLLGQTTPTSGGLGNTTGCVGGIDWWQLTAYASGTATALNAYINSVTTATLYMALYGVSGSTGSLLASGSTTPAVGLNTISITNTPIVYGQSYLLAWQGTNFGSLVLADNGILSSSLWSTTNTPGNFPATLNLTGVQVTNSGNPSIYVSGTLGAGASGTPLGGPARAQFHWR